MDQKAPPLIQGFRLFAQPFGIRKRDDGGISPTKGDARSDRYVTSVYCVSSICWMSRRNSRARKGLTKRGQST